MNNFLKLFIVALVLCASVGSFANQEKHSELRIVALAPHIVENLYDIGAGDNIVGAVEYSDYPEAALSIPRVGGYHGIQVEKLLELQPDLVIAWQSGNQASDIARLKQLGLKVILSNPKNIEDVANELRYFGKETGYFKMAESVALAFEDKLRVLRQENGNKAQIAVFYQLWSEPMMTINNTTWIHQLVEVCSGKNVFGENPTPYPKIGIENVIVAQPELIIIPDEKSDRPQPKIDWQKWPEIPAVKDNQFIQVNADLLHRFSSRMLDGVDDMCAKMDAFR